MQTEHYSGDIPRTPIRFLLYTLRPVSFMAMVGFVVMILTQSIAAFLPLFFGRFIDDVTTTQDIERFAWWGIAFVIIIANITDVISAAFANAIVYILLLLHIMRLSRLLLVCIYYDIAAVAADYFCYYCR